MTTSAPGFRSAPVWVPPAIALACIATLAVSANLGANAYAVPLLGAAAALLGLMLLKASQGRAYAIGILLVLVLTLVDAKFSERETFVFDTRTAVKIGAWIVIIGIACLRWRSILRIVFEPEVILLFAYAAMVLVSTLWSQVPVFSSAAGLGLFAYGALACIVVTDLREETTIRLCLFTLLAFVCAGLLATIVAPDIAWLPASAEEGGEAANRLQGFAAHPNVLAYLTTLMLFMAMTARRQHLLGRLAFYGIFALGFGTLLATGSRTALLGFLTAWGLVACRNSRFGGTIVMSLLGLAVLALVLAACGLFPDIGSLFGKLSRTGNSLEILTLTGRTDIWEIAWGRILESPLFGWGYFATEDLIAAKVDPSYADQAKHAHNMFLESLISLGFLGSLPGFAYVFLLLGRFVTKPDPTRDQIVLLVLISGFAEPVIFGMPIVGTFFFYWVLVRDAAKRVSARTSI